MYLHLGGSFAEAQATLSGQAQKAIFAMKKYLDKFVNVIPSHYLQLFDKLVAPILNYASEVWGFAKAAHIYYFVRNVLSVKHCTQNDFVYGELGRYTFQNIRYYNIIKFWIKILHFHETKFVKIMYNDSLNILNKTSWVTLFRDLLINLAFRHVWIQQNVGDKKVFLSLVKQRLVDTFVQNWNSRLTDSSRALFYRNFSFGYKSYLDNVTTSKFRIALSRLRVCSHRLRSKLGGG